jgi:hypothetical protein
MSELRRFAARKILELPRKHLTDSKEIKKSRMAARTLRLGNYPRAYVWKKQLTRLEALFLVTELAARSYPLVDEFSKLFLHR